MTTYPTLYKVDGAIHQIPNREYFGEQPEGALALKFSDAVSEEEWVTSIDRLYELERESAPLAYTEAGMAETKAN